MKRHANHLGPNVRADMPNATCYRQRSGVAFAVSAVLSAAMLCVAAWADLGNADEPPAAAASERPLTAGDRDHWAFRPIRRPDVPAIKDERWCRTQIDRFVLAKLEAAGLKPQSGAARTTLIRRLSFDLTGLPPTPDDVDRFVRDESPQAYEQLVERLLDSPAYGERWAQHWLDVARFAETDGFEFDHVRPNAWRYRDWVIDALNRDLPYDEFLRLQLAGDEIHPNDPEAIVATGFLLCGPDMPDVNLQEERRHNFLNDLTGTMSSVVFGLQAGCAACHDHKFDPISQLDFYRLRAFFDGVEIFADHPLPRPMVVGGPPPIEPPAELVALENQLRQIEEAARTRLAAENPDLQPTSADLVKSLSADDRREHKRLSDSIAETKKALNIPETPQGRVVRESSARQAKSYLWERGDFRRKGPEVAPAFLRIANLESSSFVALAPSGTSNAGRRTQLAAWATRPDNPLTARVIVNRIWQQHFGRGLVDTPSDFGRMGSEPTHPELLDWLASELPRQGWSLKWLHRQIVASAVYRQASRPPGPNDGAVAAALAEWEQARKADPQDRLLWHAPRQRLDGEAIRDALLASGGLLNDRRGGPGVRPPLPEELVSTLLKNQWVVSPDTDDHNRRSIYLFVRRNLRYPLFEAFDRPDTNASCPARNRSTIAPQALILLNSDLSLGAARALAGLAYRQAAGADSADRVRLAYLRTLGRTPTTDEQRTARTFLEAQTARLRASGRAADALAIPSGLPAGADPYAAAALTDFCLALFNLNEFVYVD